MYDDCGLNSPPILSTCRPLAHVQRIGKAPIAVVVWDSFRLNRDIRKAGDGHDRKAHGAQILRVHALNSQGLDYLVAFTGVKPFTRYILESLLVQPEARGVDQPWARIRAYLPR